MLGRENAPQNEHFSLFTTWNCWFFRNYYRTLRHSGIPLRFGEEEDPSKIHVQKPPTRGKACLRLRGCTPWCPHSFSCRTSPVRINVTAGCHSPTEVPATAQRGAHARGSRSSEPQRLTFHQGLRRRLSLFALLLLLFPRFLFAVATFWVLFAFRLLGTRRHLNVKRPEHVSPASPPPQGAPRVSRQAMRRPPGGDAERSHPTWLSDTFLDFCSTWSFSSWNPSCVSILSAATAKQGSCRQRPQRAAHTAGAGRHLQNLLVSEPTSLPTPDQGHDPLEACMHSHLQEPQVPCACVLGWPGRGCWDLKTESRWTSYSPGPRESDLGCCTSR